MHHEFMNQSINLNRDHIGPAPSTMKAASASGERLTCARGKWSSTDVGEEGEGRPGTRDAMGPRAGTAPARAASARSAALPAQWSVCTATKVCVRRPVENVCRKARGPHAGAGPARAASASSIAWYIHAHHTSASSIARYIIHASVERPDTTPAAAASTCAEAGTPPLEAASTSHNDAARRCECDADRTSSACVWKREWVCVCVCV